MIFLSLSPLIFFGGIALLVAGVSAAVEIRHRRRVPLKLRRIFRPVVIQGGKPDLISADRSSSEPTGANEEPVRIKIVR